MEVPGSSGTNSAIHGGGQGSFLQLGLRMKGTPDPITLALTGQLPFVVLVAAILALPISLFLLWLYRRAVLRSMRGRSGTAVPSTPSAQTSSPPTSDIGLSFDAASADLPLGPYAEALFRQASRGPWQAAAVYCAAGGFYAFVMSLVWLVATRSSFHPVRFLWLFWTYAWPVVLTANLVAGSTKRKKAYLVSGYFAVLGVLAAIALVLSPQLTLWQLIIAHWLVMNGPPTVLLLAFLVRRIRAVGPLVITFMVVGVMGSVVGLSIAGRSDRVLRYLAGVCVRMGFSGKTMFWLLILIGFVIFGVVGWAVLQVVRRRYERKRISDQSLTCDSIWLLFSIVQSIDLVFDGWWWIFTGLAGFIVYKAVVKVGFSWLHRGQTYQAPKLLLLRVFSLGKRSGHLFNALGKHWLRTGSVRMIAGPDLATSTVEPHEFLDFLSGKLSRRFIDGPEALDLRLHEMDTHPDWDGRFRVTDFFCHDDTWKMVLARLIGESDAVLMDLRGFSQRNAGCSHEIEELLNIAPLGRVVFVVDRTTDVAFLEGVAKAGWSRLRTDSPNRERESNQLRLFRLTGSHSGELAQLLRWICAAAGETSAV